MKYKIFTRVKQVIYIMHDEVIMNICYVHAEKDRHKILAQILICLLWFPRARSNRRTHTQVPDTEERQRGYTGEVNAQCY